MEVNKILRLSVTMLQLKDIEDIIKATTIIEEVQNDDLELLLNCVNLVCCAIATDYIPLVKTKQMVCNSGTLAYQDIADNGIYKILKVKDQYSRKVPYRITGDGIACPKGNLEVTYSYFPTEYKFNDTINEFKTDLTERVVAMGVVSEYLFIRGNSDDASVWEERFKNAMRSIVRPRNEIIIPKRRWW